MVLPIIIVLVAWVRLRVINTRLSSQLSALNPKNRHNVEKEALHELFRIADEDNSGTVDPREMASILRQLGWKLNIETGRKIALLVGGEINIHGQLVITKKQFLNAILSGSMEHALTSFKIYRTDEDSKKAVLVHTEGKHRTKSTRSLKRRSKIKMNASLLNEMRNKILATETALIQWTLRRRYLAKTLSGASQLLLLAHTPVSRKVFQYFHCNDIAGVMYMKADYTIICGSVEWWSFLPVVLATLVLFTIALPAGIGILIFVRRKQLYSTSVYQQIGFLYRGYRRRSEFWTIHDVLLKMILTGMLIYIPPHARAGAAILICLFAVGNLNLFKPHRNRAMFWLCQLSFCVTSCKYVMTLLLRNDQMAYDDQESIGVVLIILDSIFIVSALLSILLAFLVIRKKIQEEQNTFSILSNVLKSDESVKVQKTSSMDDENINETMPHEDSSHHQTVCRVMSHHSMHEESLRSNMKARQMQNRLSTMARVQARLQIRKSKTLNRVPAFSSLSEEGFKKVIDSMEYSSYTRGDIIVKQGDLAERFYVIVSGSCCVSLYQPGRAMKSVAGAGVRVEEFKVATLNALDFFGESAFEGIIRDNSDGSGILSRRTASVTVQSKEVKTLELGRNEFMELIKSGAVDKMALEVMAKTGAERSQKNKEHFHFNPQVSKLDLIH